MAASVRPQGDTLPETPKMNVDKYALDDNDQEAFRLREQHHIIKAAMGGQLILAPVDFEAGGLRILDSGTADGYWLHDLVADLARSHPDAAAPTLIGTDISSKRFPGGGSGGSSNSTTATTTTTTTTTAATAAAAATDNVTLYEQSITEPWPAAWRGGFDVVHQRFTLAGCRTYPVGRAVGALCELARPGGWVQLVEPEQHAGAGDGPVMRRFVGMIQEVLRCTGMDLAYTPLLAEALRRDGGLQDVRERRFDLLLGAANPDPDLAAKGVRSTRIAVSFFVQLVRALPHAMKTSLTDAELDGIVADLEAELLERGGNYPFRVVWGRKPA